MAERESHTPVSASAGTIDERASNCFGCSPGNPQGLKLKFVIATDEAGIITATCHLTLTNLHEGPPGYIHGGIIATLLDEVMSKLNRPLDILAMTRSLSVDYLRPSPLNVPLLLVGRHVKREGRKVFHTADLMRPDGPVLAHAEGFFLVVPPEMMKR